MKNILLAVLTGLILLSCSGRKNGLSDKDREIEKKVRKILSGMTLEEKIGQMNQFSGSIDLTGPKSHHKNFADYIKKGLIGSIINTAGVDNVRKLQQMAVDCTRLHIPMIFGLDVIHGYKTTFPVPLGEACSWDTATIRMSAHIAATEAAAAGLNWTFAPMVDIGRDARWGRVMEGAGEDPYLGSLIAAARVKGFQGDDLSADNTIMACAKHYAGYGFAEGGRDYNTVDMSEYKLRNVVLPPFKAASEAGCATFMHSFNELSDIPATGNEFLIRTILKGEWNFQGFTVSDWGSVGEMINHGFAADTAEAAMKGVIAGCDMDMESESYVKTLVKLVRDGKVKESLIDEAVGRILRMKFKLGLFDDPYRYCNAEREKKTMFCEAHLKAALDAARKSIVLLKNENNILPLSKKIRSIALIGPYVDDARDPLGNWPGACDPAHTITLIQGVKNKLGDSIAIHYAQGCTADKDDKSMFAEAVSAASHVDAIVMEIGEPWWMTGENNSRVFLNIPGVQEDLVKEIQKLGKPVIIILHNGRPLCINWLKNNVPVIIEAWQLGTRSGDALADVLFGDYNPSGRLVSCFPQAVGQCPIYYSYKSTGRPNLHNDRWATKYIDVSNDPLYTFGYGLSYTIFDYSDIKLNAIKIKENDTLKATITITNSGKYTGEETVQLYIRDITASIDRPVKELKGFRKLTLKPGEKKEVVFSVTFSDLAFWNRDMKFTAEPGKFILFIGKNSADCKEAQFDLQ
jgi:beta-glucosidase